jgi:hypothetical protein
MKMLAPSLEKDGPKTFVFEIYTLSLTLTKPVLA